MKIILDDAQKNKVNYYSKIKGYSCSIDKYNKNDSIAGNRFINGGMGECAITEKLGFNWSPFGFGSGLLNNYPDLMPYNICMGVKTSRIGYKHVVPLSIHSDELLCHITNEKSIIPLGILTQEILDLYGNINLLHGDLKNSGKPKTGFNMYQYLKGINWTTIKDDYRTYLEVKKSDINLLNYMLKRSIYIELINKYCIGYCVIEDGNFKEYRLIDFNYNQLLNGKKSCDSFKEFVELMQNNIVLSFGMSGLFYQISTLNEKFFGIYGDVQIVDIFEMVSNIDVELTRQFELSSVYDFSTSVKRCIDYLMRRLSIPNIQSSNVYVIQNCVNCLKIYEKLPFLLKY